MSEIKRLREENKQLKEQLKLVDGVVDKIIKDISRQFSAASMKYAVFKEVEPKMEFSLEMPEEDILGQYMKATDTVVVYLPSFKNTVFMREFEKGNEDYLIQFLTEGIQHEYIHSCLKEIGIFSMSDEEALVDALIRNHFTWWRKMLQQPES